MNELDVKQLMDSLVAFALKAATTVAAVDEAVVAAITLAPRNTTGIGDAESSIVAVAGSDPRTATATPPATATNSGRNARQIYPWL